MDQERPDIRTLDELERFANIQRNEAPSLTRRDARALERKFLGRMWGRKRRKMTGWPR